jgi:hypothetical protein
MVAPGSVGLDIALFGVFAPAGSALVLALPTTGDPAVSGLLFASAPRRDRLSIPCIAAD